MQKKLGVAAASAALGLAITAGVALAQSPTMMPEGTSPTSGGNMLNNSTNQNMNQDQSGTRQPEQGVGGSETVPGGAPATGLGGSR